MVIYEKILKKFLNQANIGLGDQPGFDVSVRVHNPKFYKKTLSLGTLEIGEAYMDGWWDSERLDEVVARLLSARVAWLMLINPQLIFSLLKNLMVNAGVRKKAFQIVEKHYDIGNDLFERTLGKTMAYTCGYWREGVRSLDEAQIAKQDLICRKLDLRPGRKLLDIGCGWGGFAKQAAEDYGVSVVGVTISEEQAEYARKLCAGLPVEIRIQDWRDIDEKFDYISVIGMIEHVGSKNYKRFMRMVERNLKDNGRFLLHTIGKRPPTVASDPWINKYIFPNGMVPPRRSIQRSVRGRFNIWDWHEFGKYYDPTLMAWLENFDRSWDELKDRYASAVDGKFYRMWRYYLLTCAGAFRAGRLKLWQILLSKKPKPEDYKKVR